MTTTLNQLLETTAVNPTPMHLRALRQSLQESTLLLPIQWLDEDHVRFMALTGEDGREYLALYTTKAKVLAAAVTEYVAVNYQQWVNVLTQVPELAAVAIDPDDANVVMWPEDLALTHPQSA